MAVTTAPDRLFYTQRKARLVIFVHGWLGRSDKTTWARFPDLIRQDSDIQKIYDVEEFSYPTAATRAGTSTPVPHAAELLRTRLETDWKEYRELAVIAHSQGGLVTRRYVADQLLASRPHRIGRVLYFASPHMGALGGKLGHTPGASQELIDLSYDSEMLQKLLTDEANSLAHLRVPARFVVAQGDWLVGKTSAWGIGHPGDYLVVPGEDHRSVIKPENSAHVAFKIARDFLLDQNIGSAALYSAIHEQPSLKTKQWNQSAEDRARNRFVYWNRETPFEGRDIEERVLDEFLTNPTRRFSWMLMAGSTGMGKSRLALELVLAKKAGWWHAGFLDYFPTREYWHRWQPCLPTLIVVDYAAKDPDCVGTMLAALAEREPPNLLRHPVRVLLIVRDPNDARVERLLGASRLLRGDSTRAADLVLETTEVQHIFDHVLGKGMYDPISMLETLEEIDGQCCPLFAFLLADALKREKNARSWDQDALLAELIRRERREFWEPAAVAAGLPALFPKEERALALATIVGGLPLRSLPDHNDDVLPSWLADQHPVLFAAMTGGVAIDGIPPIEPDIVGEFFALELLERLRSTSLRSGGSMADELLRRAWQVNPRGTSEFLLRCVHDFKNSRALRRAILLTPPTLEGRANWSLLARDLVFLFSRRTETFDSAISVYNKLKRLAKMHPSEADTRQELGSALVNLIRNCVRQGILRVSVTDKRAELRELLKEYARKKDYYVVKLLNNDLQNLKRVTRRFLKLLHPAATLERALELYEVQKTLAISYPDEKVLCLHQAKSALNLIGDLASQKSTIRVAQAVCHDFKEMIGGAIDKEIRERHASAIAHLIYWFSQRVDTFEAALKAYAELKALAAAHPLDSSMRWALARSALHVTHQLLSVKGTEERAYEIYADVRALGNPSKLWPARAGIAASLIWATAATKLDAAKEVYEDLCGLEENDVELSALGVEAAMGILPWLHARDALCGSSLTWNLAVAVHLRPDIARWCTNTLVPSALQAARTFPIGIFALQLLARATAVAGFCATCAANEESEELVQTASGHLNLLPTSIQPVLLGGFQGLDTDRLGYGEFRAFKTDSLSKEVFDDPFWQPRAWSMVYGTNTSWNELERVVGDVQKAVRAASVLILGLAFGDREGVRNFLRVAAGSVAAADAIATIASVQGHPWLEEL